MIEAESRNPVPRAFSAVTWDSRGVWRCSGGTGISYPSSGNAWTFSVEDGSFWFRHRNRCIRALIEMEPPPGPIFDVGGGNGFVAIEVQRAGFDVVLVEPGPIGARNAVERGVKHVVCGTLQDAGPRASSMHAVGLFDVLEHFEDDRGLLREIHRSLVPKGKIYLTVPAYSWLWSQEDELAGHYRRYAMESLRRALEESGYSLTFASYFFVPLPPPIFLLRALPARLALPSNASPPERAARDHGLHLRRLGPLVDRVLGWEVACIRARRRLPAGGSILAVAEKR